MNQMQLLPSRFFCYMLLLTAGVILLSNLDTLWSQSVDLAHHYALAYRVSEQFHLISSNDPTLGEMNFYPRLAHIFAAIIGTSLGSILLGVQIVSMLSMAGIWGGFVYLINTLPKKTALISSLALATLIITNKATLNLELHGSEINSNFFYSQLVGQAVIILAIATAMACELKNRRYISYLFLIVIIAVSTSIHLLPTLELLGTLTGLVLLNAYLDFAKNERNVIWIAASLIIPIIGLCGVVLNPAFSAMRKIAENNGSLELAHISYPVGLTTLCLIGAIISIWLLGIYIKKKDLNNYLLIKYIACYGIAICSLCLLQMLLANYELGSEYAVKKYAFGITSYLFVATALLIGLGCTNPALNKYFRWNHNQTLHTLIVTICFYIIAKAAINPHENHKVSDLVRIEKALIITTSAIIPEAKQGKSNVIIGLKELPTTFNYMFSIALAKTPRDLAIPDVLLANSLSNFDKYTNVISSSNSKKYDIKQCEVHSGGRIVVNNASCLAEHNNLINDCNKTFDFSVNGLIDQKNLKGFSIPEVEGTWMVGNNSTFMCEILSTAPKKMLIKLSPFTGPGLAGQNLKILINGKSIYNETITTKSPPISLNLPENMKGEVSISFITPDAISPQRLGISQDKRILSFYFKSIEFE